MPYIQVLFWTALFFMIYAFAGFPLILWLMSRFHRNTSPLRKSGELPKVTLLISAYNEEAVIKDKLQNSLELEYPRDRLDILVVSDASSDNTDKLVGQFSDQGVRSIRQQTRQGKTAALNLGVPTAKGEIVVFSDANALYDRNALKNLARHFQNPRIGFVSGWTKYITSRGDSVSESTSLYGRLELLTKRYESCFGTCIGADGAIFAIRRSLYRPLQPYDINDFVIPLQILEQGFQGILDETAFCLEETAGHTAGEFKRQTRITNRTIRAISNHSRLLNPLRFPFAAFALFSHKLLKFLLPFFMLLALGTNLLLLRQGVIFQLCILGQALYYTLAAMGFLLEKYHRHNRLAAMAYTFAMVSWAFFLGWTSFLAGETYVTWTPPNRTST